MTQPAAGQAMHLVSVWNPTLVTNALEAHLKVLLDWNNRPAPTATGADAPDDESAEHVFVWWGKVKSSQRQQAMPHLADVMALSAQITAGEGETHLYLTDYRSLYVADVGRVTDEDPRRTDADHVPRYYTDQQLTCDCWFALHDLRLLVRDDLEAVAVELARLRNTRYADRPVSIYGGMVDLPLLVKRPQPRRYFSEDERDLLADGRLWAAFDSEQGGLSAVEATLRDDHFGDALWRTLDSSTRRFIAMAESTFRMHRRDPAADLSPVLVGYSKALEVQVSRVLEMGIEGAPEPLRHLNVDGRSLRLPDALPLSLGVVARAIYDDEFRSAWLRKSLADGDWLVAEFGHALKDFADRARNPASHTSAMSRDDVATWRARLLGVGEPGLLLRLARISRRK